MSKFTREMIDDYANKLLIGLTEEENEVVLDEFNIIEARMEKIANISDISEIEPMHYPFEVDIVLRDEKVVENENIEDILKNSDKVNDRDIEVPKVVG